MLKKSQLKNKKTKIQVSWITPFENFPLNIWQADF